MLAELARQTVAAEQPVLDAHGLSMWAYIVLSVLDHSPIRTQAALAEAIGADKTRIIPTLDELQQHGYIERMPDPDDRRARLLAITESGRSDQGRRAGGYPARRGALARTAFRERARRVPASAEPTQRPRCRLGCRGVNDGRPDVNALARTAAQFIADRIGIADHDVAIVLGSGWAPAVSALGRPTATLPMADVPGFTPPSAAGHTGQVLSVGIGGHRVLVLAGRVHAYEGHDLLHVVHPVRTACAAGARVVVLTNAAGAVCEDFTVGQPVLISDHLNLTARSPLVGAQFVDMVDAYAPRLRALAHEVDPGLAEGVYAGLPGPHFETPAEIRMLRTLGADLVGMSTVHETIAARAAGAEVLGVSLVTNMAAGITGEPLSHVEVLETGAASAARMGALLADVVARL